MYKFLLVVHAIIAAAMVGVILMQRSEGGGLAGGGSPSGLMTARGAADFLTRATTILATLFVLLSIGLAGLATFNRTPDVLDTSLAKQPVTAPAAPVQGVPLAGSVAGGQPASDPSAPLSAAPLAALPKPTAQPVLQRPKPKPAAKPAAQKAVTVTPPPVLTTPAATPEGNPQ
jgi:preprotein translocase subunit SecG